MIPMAVLNWPAFKIFGLFKLYSESFGMSQKTRLTERTLNLFVLNAAKISSDNL